MQLGRLHGSWRPRDTRSLANRALVPRIWCSCQWVGKVCTSPTLKEHLVPGLLVYLHLPWHHLLQQKWTQCPYDDYVRNQCGKLLTGNKIPIYPSDVSVFLMDWCPWEVFSLNCPLFCPEPTDTEETSRVFPKAITWSCSSNPPPVLALLLPLPEHDGEKDPHDLQSQITPTLTSLFLTHWELQNHDTGWDIDSKFASPCDPC